MKTILLRFVPILVLLISVTAAQADLLDLLGLRKKSGDTNASNSPAAASLSQEQTASGLKEALGKGLQQAIAQLGHEGGFLTNANVRIPMPEKLRTVEKTLRTLKQDKLADDFVTTMNHAAEQAVPEAAPVFADAVKQMSFADAKGILLGTNDAATTYFRQATQSNLFTRFHPIVEKATSSTGVTAAYKKMMGSVGSSKTFGALGGLLNQDTTDIDNYVTTKTLDGLFKMVAEEEKRIRQNPAARTTELLQKVFGSVTR